MKIKLTNNFHNTEVTLNIKDDGTLSSSQVKKAKKALCGIDGCTCGNVAGQRGRQEWVVIDLNDKDYKAVKSNTF